MLMVEGQGMHKSKGNFITMKGAVEKYGADATRCGLMLGAEGIESFRNCMHTCGPTTSTPKKQTDEQANTRGNTKKDENTSSNHAAL
jgi:valyl-tRNA synthetase